MSGRSAEADGPVILVLTPVYNEAESLPQFERAVRDVLLNHTECRFEILFVDDGSSDSSWRVICDICAREGRFKGLRLSRNFGSHVAISAGLACAEDADAVAILACDLQ